MNPYLYKCVVTRVVDGDTVAVINDNDFGEGGVPIGLGLVNLSNGLDPSDRDGAIDIQV